MTDPLPGARPKTTSWTTIQAARAAAQPEAALPVITRDAIVALDPAFDVWDMWPIAHRDGRTATIEGRQWWFFLAAPRAADPEARHDAARIHLYSIGPDGWRAHGAAFPDGFSPGSREWSGTAVLHDDGCTVTMHFTAAGRRGVAHSFEQRLFETTGRFADGWVGGWSRPVETVAADGATYLRANQPMPFQDRIKGFRDPGYFRDPATGAEHLLFTGSAGWVDDIHDGVIGLATRRDAGWRLNAPLLSAIGVNSELERPHVLIHDGAYYLFWSTQAKRFAPGIGAPTGLYGMVADALAGPWRPLNGSGLVAANPPAEPSQAYCWWVTGEHTVISFIDYWDTAGVHPGADIARRRARFGGTVAPAFGIELRGDRATITPGCGLHDHAALRRDHD